MAFVDANYRPSPVPLQTGRTNYVDSDRLGFVVGACKPTTLVGLGSPREAPSWVDPQGYRSSTEGQRARCLTAKFRCVGSLGCGSKQKPRAVISPRGPDM